jgi:predicted transcriptional regulator
MNADKIRGKIAENRMSISEFCRVAGFDRSTFDRKMKGDSEFNRNEIERIITTLHLTDDETRTIFFENVVA